MHTIKRELNLQAYMTEGKGRCRSLFLALLFLLSIASFGANTTQAAEGNVGLEPWALVDSTTDVRTTRLATAGSDLVISSFVENENTIRAKLYHPDGTTLPIVVIHQESSGQIQSLEVVGEECEGAERCKLHFGFTVISDGTANNGALRYALYEIDSVNGTLTEIIAPQSIVSRNNLRDIAMGIDSKGGVHLSWTDDYDPAGVLHGTDQIRYTMLQLILPQFIGGMTPYADALISDTLLTTNYGSKGHSSIAIDEGDRVIVAWDDVRGSSVEMVFVMPTPTNGYLNGEWSDVCSVMYGGTYDAGILPSLKDMAEANGILLMETIYGLHDQTPSQANQNNCQGYNTNQRSRSTPLSSTDDSGGIRRLQDTIYNGQPPAAWWLDERDDWGPGTTWACMSWMDANGNTGAQSNPPTSSDHRWNEGATHVVIPFGVEGPYQGDPAQNNNDKNSIEEAHRRCIDGGTTVAPVYAYPVNNPNDVFDNMLDLAWCPDSGVNTVSRSCPGTTSQTRNMSSDVIEWRQTNGGLENQWNEISKLANLGTRDIWMTALDPWTFLSSGSSFVNGSSATVFDSNQDRYVERIGVASTGNLVVVNDTALIENDAMSAHPRIAFDNNGYLHLVWTDGWTHTTLDSLPTEILHNRFELPDLGTENGRPSGLDSTDFGSFTTLVPTNVSVIESGTIGEDWADHNAELKIDGDGAIHVAWVDAVSTNGEDAILHATLVAPSSFPGGSFESIRINVENDGSDKNGPRPTMSVLEGERPSIIITDSGITTISYTAKGDCSFSGGTVYNLCIGRLAPSLHIIRGTIGESLEIEIEPGDSGEINLEVAIREGTGLAQLKVDLSNPSTIGCDGWITSFRFTQNNTEAIMPLQDIVIGNVPLGLTAIFQAPTGDQLSNGAMCQTQLVATEGPMSSDITVSASLIVNRTMDLRIMQSTIAIEQGDQDGVTIEIENTGNVPIDVLIADPSTSSGRLDWQLPENWEVQVIQNIRLNPSQSTSTYATINVPLTAVAEEVELRVRAWIEQDPTPTNEEGTSVWRTFTVDVGIKSSGNIVLELLDNTGYTQPGDCENYDILITKSHGDGEVIISEINAPKSNSNFIVEYYLDGGGEQSLPLTLMLQRDSSVILIVKVCSKSWAEADETWIMSIDASLVEDSTIGDDVQFSTTVLAVHDLKMTLLTDDEFEATSGERYEFRIAIQNEGNILELIEPQIQSESGEAITGIFVQFAEDSPTSIEPGQSADLVGFIEVNDNASAGENLIRLIMNDESSEVEIKIIIPLRIDMSLGLLGGNFGTLESDGSITWTFVIQNKGNSKDQAFLSLHKDGEEGIESMSDNEPLPFHVVSLHEGSLEDENLGANIGVDAMGIAMLGLIDAGEERIVRIHVVVGDGNLPAIETLRFGVKINSEHGGREEGGDVDSTPGWIGPDYDSNEQILLVEFQAMDLQFGEISQARVGDQVDITAELLNLGNIMGENIVVIACPDVSPTSLAMNGCPLGEVKTTVPSISSINGSEAGNRRITLRVDSTKALEWTLQIDPENRLVDINLENNLASFSLEIEEESGFFESFVNPSEGNTLNILIAGLIAIIGGLVLIMLIFRIGGRRRVRKDPWMKESRAWAKNEIPSMPPQNTATVPPPPGLPANSVVQPQQNDPYSDLDEMNIGDLLGDLL